MAATCGFRAPGPGPAPAARCRIDHEWFIDLLRNEKPVFCTLNSDKPKWNGLYSGKEPVGEIEI